MQAVTKPKSMAALTGSEAQDLFSQYVPKEVWGLENPQTAIPRIAKDSDLVRRIEARVQNIPTAHDVYLGDARRISNLQPESVHLVVTSPPYWTLKQYRNAPGQIGHIERRKNAGRHTVVPLHASIQEHCRKIGFDNLAAIIWYKIANAVYEVENGSAFLGKPYEPNAVIKNDIEFILMERKPGGYRTPSVAKRVLSVISTENHREWFQQVWSGLSGASTREHPAPFPLELAERLVRMFSFVGDTVLDPFLGTGTTTVAAAKWGRNSIAYEVDEHYHTLAVKRIKRDTCSLFSATTIRIGRETGTTIEDGNSAPR